MPSRRVTLPWLAGLLLLTFLLGLATLAVRARHEPPAVDAGFFWLILPSLLYASAAMAVTDRRQAIRLGLALLLSLVVTLPLLLPPNLKPNPNPALTPPAFPLPSSSPTSVLVPKFLPLYQLGLPLLVGGLAWAFRTLLWSPRSRGTQRSGG